MSELKSHDLVDIQDYRGEVYIKSEADKVITDLEESHKMEVAQLLMEIVGLKKTGCFVVSRITQEPEV